MITYIDLSEGIFFNNLIGRVVNDQMLITAIVRTDVHHCEGSSVELWDQIFKHWDTAPHYMFTQMPIRMLVYSCYISMPNWNLFQEKG